jgi:alpha-2-macroglobulin
MRLPLLPLAAAAAVVTFSAAPEPLRIVRAEPGAIAAPTDTIVVSFDRPVAGGLDAPVDPRDVITIAPAIEARFEWRNPVTLQVIPRAPLPRGSRYTLTVSTSVRGLDGSTLTAPYTTRFRVRGPTLLFGTPVTGADTSRHIAHRPTFTLVYDAPLRPDVVARTARIEPLRGCRDAAGRTPTVRLQPAPGAQTARDTVRLVTDVALPADCTATLVAPREVIDGGARTDAADLPDPARWLFRTHGTFRVIDARCAARPWCPNGPFVVRFSTPVRGADLATALQVAPEAPLDIDTARVSDSWRLGGRFAPRRAYALIAQPALRDVFGQSLTGNPAVGVRTTGYAPDVQAPFGRLTIERTGFRTLAVQTMNVDTLLVERLMLPDSAVARLLADGEWSWREYWQAEQRRHVRTRVPLTPSPDRTRIVAVAIPTGTARESGLQLVRVRDAAALRDTANQDEWFRLALVQVTDLGVHAKVGDDAGTVWVTDARDGKVRSGVQISLHDRRGRVLARATTNADGMAELRGYTWPRRDTADASSLEEAYVLARAGDDRATLAVRDGDPDLAPWRFGISGAWGVDRADVAGAMFTERDLYRPGETVHVKAIVRRGALGALNAAGPGDSVRWVRRNAEYELTDSVPAVLSEFGTADTRLPVASDAPLGTYSVSLEWRHRQEWRTLASTSYRIAEFRPAEFLVDLATLAAPARGGDTLRARVSARYLFGGAMTGAGVQWSLTREPLPSWELGIAGMDDWMLGDNDDGWAGADGDDGTEFIASGNDSLGADGSRVLAVPTPELVPGRAMRLTLTANVADVNRRVVGSRATSVMHPADVYIAARVPGTDWFWRTNVDRTIDVASVRPDGERTAGLVVSGALVRREWHRVSRVRDGITEEIGEWVADTVARCRVTTTRTSAPCTLRPQKGGAHSVILTARDAGGRDVRTAFTRWVVGPDWVPWNDDNQLKLDVVADRARYAPGDTATLMFVTPFTNAEAWITVEREGILSQQRLRLTSGTTTFRLPITEAHAPNVFVSMLVARGRSQKPGTIGDPGRPTIRVGYAQLRVAPDVKRLQVSVQPERAQYRPGDSARIDVTVRDAAGRGAAGEVTLWAVDEGVLSLTGYRTPDPLDLLYQPRGLGMLLGSSLANVAPQLPAGEKARRAPGGGGGDGGDDILRSRFRSTAFFLGSVRTDANGVARATAMLPDNLTTFRVMAVAITRTDRFGSGDAPLLVTRPLVARPALPRFVREGDQVEAGVVVNRREGASGSVRVAAQVTGAKLDGRNRRDVRVDSGRGVEVRFPTRIPVGDTVRFRFDATGGRDRDAVQLTLPVRPAARAVLVAASTMARDRATLSLPLLDAPDHARSTLSITLGASPLTLVQGALPSVRAYPWQCTEQIGSTALPLLALLDADLAPATARTDLAATVRALQQRQRYDGGIGYWSSSDWTTPWLSAHAALTLAAARDAGLRVDSLVLSRLADYLTQAAGEAIEAYAPERGRTPVSRRHTSTALIRTEYVAAAEALRALGRPDVSLENDLLREAAQLTPADRARLARVIAERGDRALARPLLESLWRRVVRDDDRAWLPDSLNRDGFYFASPLRGTGELLRATLAVDPDHPLVGPLVAQAVRDARAGSGWFGVTTDLATIVRAFAVLHARQAQAADRGVQISVNGRRVLDLAPRAPGVRGARDTTLTLATLASRARPERGDTLQLELSATGSGPAMYVTTSLRVVPRMPPDRPLDRGLQLERWTESFETGAPITSVNAGDLVRVKVRLTVPAERAFVTVEDPLPAGLEPVDLSLRTALLTAVAPRAGETPVGVRTSEWYGDEGDPLTAWSFGRWDAGYWTPFEYRNLRDDRVTWSATTVFPGRYTLSYLARATVPGRFVRPPAFAEEMYDPSVFGRTEGGVFTIVPPR